MLFSNFENGRFNLTIIKEIYLLEESSMTTYFFPPSPQSCCSPTSIQLKFVSAQWQEKVIQ